MNILGKGAQQHTFDAIVIGSGMSGGWAAKELAERGLKTIVFERGRDVKHGDYPTAFKEIWEFEGRGRPTKETLERKPKQSRTGITTVPASAHWFVDDIDHPYNEAKPFDWMRGHHTGGRSLLWGRYSWRIGDVDFEAHTKDGVGIDWPVRYRDLKPWYDHVEDFAGITGQNEGLEYVLPDGNFLPPWEMNCVEKHVRKRMKEHFNDRILTIARSSNLTVAHGGRGP